jgi:hypothetical protein
MVFYQAVIYKNASSLHGVLGELIQVAGIWHIS